MKAGISFAFFFADVSVAIREASATSWLKNIAE